MVSSVPLSYPLFDLGLVHAHVERGDSKETAPERRTRGFSKWIGRRSKVRRDRGRRIHDHGDYTGADCGAGPRMVLTRFDSGFKESTQTGNGSQSSLEMVLRDPMGCTMALNIGVLLPRHQ